MQHCRQKSGSQRMHTNHHLGLYTQTLCEPRPCIHGTVDKQASIDGIIPRFEKSLAKQKARLFLNIFI